MAKFNVGDLVDINLDYGRVRAARIVEIKNMLDAPGISKQAIRGTEGPSHDLLKGAAMYKVEIPFSNKIWGEYETEDGRKSALGGSYTGEMWIPEVYVEPLENKSFSQLWDSPLR